MGKRGAGWKHFVDQTQEVLPAVPDVGEELDAVGLGPFGTV